jgi:hypothetical protein
LSASTASGPSPFSPSRPAPTLTVIAPSSLNCGSGMSTPCSRMHWANSNASAFIRSSSSGSGGSNAPRTASMIGWQASLAASISSGSIDSPGPPAWIITPPPGPPPSPSKTGSGMSMPCSRMHLANSSAASWMSASSGSSLLLLSPSPLSSPAGALSSLLDASAIVVPIDATSPSSAVPLSAPAPSSAAPQAASDRVASTAAAADAPRRSRFECDRVIIVSSSCRIAASCRRAG